MSRDTGDLTGAVFGRLKVIHAAGSQRTPNGTVRRMWLCECDCGRTTTVQVANLRSGATRSCGCLREEAMRNANRTHGNSSSREYGSWRAMRERCTNPNNSHYRMYGGRGIRICERWAVFDNFLMDMGPRPAGTTLDRFPDVDGNYEPANCRWATPAQQSRNTTRNVTITWDGETMCLKDWATRLGMTHIALKHRLDRWPIERAMTTPNRQTRASTQQEEQETHHAARNDSRESRQASA